jgi:N-acetylmuramoyl-L-alanine amidase
MRRLLVLIVLLCAAVPSTADAAMPMLGKSKATPAGAAKWARSHGATPTFVRLAKIYWRLAPRRGVRPEVAYAQAAKETNFGRFTGVLDASFRNPCGLKVTAGGGNYDPGAHKRFPSWRAGIAAHLDHMALYAGATGYPRRSTPDPRHFPFLRGKARTVERLGGKWAPSPSYGRDLARLVRTLVEAAPKPKAKPRPKPVVKPTAPRVLRPVPVAILRARGTQI